MTSRNIPAFLTIIYMEEKDDMVLSAVKNDDVPAAAAPADEAGPAAPARTYAGRGDGPSDQPPAELPEKFVETGFQTPGVFKHDDGGTMIGNWFPVDPEYIARNPGCAIDQDSVIHYVELADFHPLFPEDDKRPSDDDPEKRVGRILYRWLSLVMRHMEESPYPKGTPQNAFDAIMNSIYDNHIRYLPSPPLRVGQRATIWANLASPASVLARKEAECRQTALLVTATLAWLGFQAAYVISEDHAISAVVSVKDEIEGVKGLPFHPVGTEAGTVRYLYPFDATAPAGNNDRKPFEQRLKEGMEFASGILNPERKSTSIVVDVNGNVLYRDPRILEVDPDSPCREKGLRPDLGW
jgi:hypothetical protein